MSHSGRLHEIDDCFASQACQEAGREVRGACARLTRGPTARETIREGRFEQDGRTRAKMATKTHPSSVCHPAEASSKTTSVASESTGKAKYMFLSDTSRVEATKPLQKQTDQNKSPSPSPSPSLSLSFSLFWTRNERAPSGVTSETVTIYTIMTKLNENRGKRRHK